MTPHAASVVRARAGASTLALLLLAGCATQPLAARAIAAQGGRLDAFTREVEADVHYGFPGLWRWDLAWRAPHRFRLGVHTAAATQHYVFDGSALLSHVGGVRVARDTGDAASYRSIGRWLSVISLHALEPGRATWEEAPPRDLGRDAVRGLSLRLRESGERYRLGFDRADRLVVAIGPVEIPGVGAGTLRAHFSDFRSVEGRAVPFHGEYRLNGDRFFEERVLRFAPGRAVLDPSRLGEELAGNGARDPR